MKAQALRDNGMSSYMSSKKTMEVNPDNAIIKEMREKTSADENDKTVSDLINLLFDVSLLESGFSLSNPNHFASRIHRMISLGLSINPDEAGDDADEDIPDLEEAGVDSTMEEVD